MHDYTVSVNSSVLQVKAEIGVAVGECGMHACRAALGLVAAEVVGLGDTPAQVSPICTEWFHWRGWQWFAGELPLPWHRSRHH